MFLFLVFVNNLCTYIYILSLHAIRFIFSEQENVDRNFFNQRYPYNIAGHSTALFIEGVQLWTATCNSVNRYWEIQHR